MSRPGDRNLLIGILALQLDFVTRDEMIAAFQTWMLDKSQSVDEILLAQNALDRATRDLILALVDKHVTFHDNDVQRNLVALGSVDSTIEVELRSLPIPTWTPACRL